MIEHVFIVTTQVDRRAGGNLPTDASLSCSQDPRPVQGIHRKRLIYESLALYIMYFNVLS